MRLLPRRGGGGVGLRLGQAVARIAKVGGAERHHGEAPAQHMRQRETGIECQHHLDPIGRVGAVADITRHGEIPRPRRRSGGNGEFQAVRVGVHAPRVARIGAFPHVRVFIVQCSKLWPRSVLPQMPPRHLRHVGPGIPEMRSKTDLIKRMARFRHAARPVPLAPGQDRLADLDGLGANPGALRARTYIPANLPAGAPLVVVLHGCTQSAAGYDHGAGWSRLADRHGFALLFPEQQAANNPNLCFNWFLPGDTRRDGGEALSIRRMIETVVVEHGIDRGRIFVNGLSAGGAMAAVMLATYPEVFAGGAIIAGLPYGGASSIPEAFALMRGENLPDARALEAAVRGASRHDGPWPIVSIWHGSADPTVNPTNAEAIGAQWRAVHGLDARPTHTETVDGQVRKVWCDAAGCALIEDFSIAGMAHGTPLSGADGVAGPYMLNMGISSTRHIAAFWGVAPAGERTLPGIMVPRLPTLAADTLPRQASVPPAREPEPAYAPAGATSRVGKVIEDALRAAGLMR